MTRTRPGPRAIPYLISLSLRTSSVNSVGRIGIRRFDSDFVDSCDLGVPVYCGYVPHQSTFQIGTTGVNGFAVGPGTGGKAAAHSTTYQLNDDVSWVRGSHQINFGMGGSMYKMIFLGNVYSQGSWNFGNIPQFLLGQFNSFAMSAPNPLPQEKWSLNGVRAGHLEGDSAPDRECGPALGTVASLPERLAIASSYNFSRGGTCSRSEEQSFC